MTSVEAILDFYTQAWNEGDPGKRHDLVARLYAADAYYANQGNEFPGIAEVERALTRNYDGFLSKGFTFEIADGAAAHHGSVRVTWRMLAPDGVTVAAAGMQFLILDDDGLVTRDYQFITQAPQS
jgi:SnoaL-like protein